MFIKYVSVGIFMALQPKIIACGNSVATFSMAVRFLTGPAVMAAASIIVGLRGTLLHVAIVQVDINCIRSYILYYILSHLKRSTLNLIFKCGILYIFFGFNLF